MSAWRAHLAIVAVALVAGAAGAWLGHTQRPATAPTEGPAASIGERRPDLRLPGLDGVVQPLSRWDGRPLLINFWAPWCAPCVEEMPALDAFAAEQGDNGVQVLGIALDAPDAVAAFLQRLPVRYPILLDRPRADDSSVRLGNLRGGLPYSVLLDAEGVIRRQHLGPLDIATLRHWGSR